MKIFPIAENQLQKKTWKLGLDGRLSPGNILYCRTMSSTEHTNDCAPQHTENPSSLCLEQKSPGQEQKKAVKSRPTPAKT